MNNENPVNLLDTCLYLISPTLKQAWPLDVQLMALIYSLWPDQSITLTSTESGVPINNHTPPLTLIQIQNSNSTLQRSHSLGFLSPTSLLHIPHSIHFLPHSDTHRLLHFLFLCIQILHNQKHRVLNISSEQFLNFFLVLLLLSCEFWAMDFHSLARRELQALCKNNKIPANMTNVAMADALKALQHVIFFLELFNTHFTSFFLSCLFAEKL